MNPTTESMTQSLFLGTGQGPADSESIGSYVFEDTQQVQARMALMRARAGGADGQEVLDDAAGQADAAEVAGEGQPGDAAGQADPVEIGGDDEGLQPFERWCANDNALAQGLIETRLRNNEANQRLVTEKIRDVCSIEYVSFPFTGFLNGFKNIAPVPKDDKVPEPMKSVQYAANLLVGLVVYFQFNLKPANPLRFGLKRLCGSLIEVYAANEIDDDLIMGESDGLRLVKFLVLCTDYRAGQFPSPTMLNLVLIHGGHLCELWRFIESLFDSGCDKLSFSNPMGFWSKVYDTIMKFSTEGQSQAKKGQVFTPVEVAARSLKEKFIRISIPQVNAANAFSLGGMADHIPTIFLGAYAGPEISFSQKLMEILNPTKTPAKKGEVVEGGSAVVVKSKRKKSALDEFEARVSKMYEVHLAKACDPKNAAVEMWLTLLPGAGSRLFGVPVHAGNLSCMEQMLLDALQVLSCGDASASRTNVELAKRYVLARLEEVSRFQQDPTAVIQFRPLDEVAKAFLGMECFMTITKQSIDDDRLSRLLEWMRDNQYIPQDVVTIPHFLGAAMQRLIDGVASKFTSSMSGGRLVFRDDEVDVHEIYVEIVRKFGAKQAEGKDKVASRANSLDAAGAARILSGATAREPPAGDGGDGEPRVEDLEVLARATEEERKDTENLICKLIMVYFRFYHTDQSLPSTAKALELFLLLCTDVNIRTILARYISTLLFELSKKALECYANEDAMKTLETSVSLVVVSITKKGYITEETTDILATKLKNFGAEPKGPAKRKRNRL